jgi:CBS domain-containing protein
MKAVDLINNDVPPIMPKESMEKALLWMDEFKVKHLPVVNNGQYVGLVSDEMIFDHNTINDRVEDLNFTGHQFSVKKSHHLYKVMQVMSTHQLTVIPVIDEQSEFIGAISAYHLMEVISLNTGFNQKGAIIVLLMNDFDYHLSQIAQIIESNNAKILGFYTENVPDGNQLKITLKVNQSKLGPVLQTFSRYDYTIHELYTDDETSSEFQERYDHLMNYLNLDS